MLNSVLQQKFAYRNNLYELVKQGNKALIYKITSKDQSIVYYEVFKIKLQKASEKIIGGKKVSFGIKVKFPGDEAFGKWAWTPGTLKEAMKKFEELENEKNNPTGI